MYLYGHQSCCLDLPQLSAIRENHFLKQFSDRMIGVHLHDVKSTTDHKVPGAGDLDFRMVSGYLSQDVVKVMQLTSEATREGIMEGLSYLKESGIS